MSKPIVSIIVPAYNSVNTVLKCVDSIKTQTFTDWELIIADNNSTDGCYDLCSQIALTDKRIKVIEVPKKGVSEARNAALDIAQGEYVCFVDSDDTVEDSFLYDLIRFKDYQLVICGYSVDIFDRKGVEIKSVLYIPPQITWIECEQKDKLIPLFENGYMHFCWNKLFHRSLIQKFNIRFKDAVVNEDFIFVLEYIKHIKSIHIVDKAIYHWIRIEGNVSGVLSIPENLLEIYNFTQSLTRSFFADDKTGDRISYFSYELILYKYYKARHQGRLTKREMYARISDFGKNTMVREAYRAYNPASLGEKILYFLVFHKLFRIHYFLTQKLLK